MSMTLHRLICRHQHFWVIKEGLLEAASSSRTLGRICQCTWHHIPDDWNIHDNENLTYWSILQLLHIWYRRIEQSLCHVFINYKNVEEYISSLNLALEIWHTLENSSLQNANQNSFPPISNLSVSLCERDTSSALVTNLSFFTRNIWAALKKFSVSNYNCIHEMSFLA